MQDVALIIITTSHVEAIDVSSLDVDRSANLSLLPPRFDNLHREDSGRFVQKLKMTAKLKETSLCQAKSKGQQKIFRKQPTKARATIVR